MKKEISELKRANDILKAAASFFAAELDRPHTLVAFIDEHRARFGGVEPICRVLTEHDCKIAPFTYCAAKKRAADPSARRVRDAALKKLITEIHEASFRVHGAGKVWRELQRQGHPVARGTVERLMRMGRRRCCPSDTWDDE